MKTKSITLLLAIALAWMPGIASAFMTSAENSLRPGQTLNFGQYEQDNNKSNGEEEIEWRVLESDANYALLISVKGLDCKTYNSSEGYVTWEECSLRQWLNNDFYYRAFDAAEQDAIRSVRLINEDDLEYGIEGGSDTRDRVFLLSISEIQRYLPFEQERRIESTEYATGQGAYSENGYTIWWLRSPGNGANDPSYVYVTGEIQADGGLMDGGPATVRPVIFVDLAKGVF